MKYSINNFPKRLTKKIIFKAYYNIPREGLRDFLNYYMIMLGKSKYSQLVPELILFYIIKHYGPPEFYKLSDEQLKKFNLIK